MKRIAFVFGTRPEAIKMFPVVHAFARAEGFRPLVILTGQHREMLDQVMAVADLKADVDLNLMKPGQSLTELTANVLTAVSPVLAELRPDMVLVQGDTTTAFIGALAAFYNRIPVAHVEAGLRSGNKYSPYPEETNRRMVAQVADLHLAPTERSRNSLLAEGFALDAIHVTGNTVVDALQWIKAKLDADPVARAKVEGDLPQPAPGKRMILVTNHRRENFDTGIASVARGLAELARSENVQIIFPVHLNPNVQAPVKQILGDVPNVHLLPPLSYLPFAALMMRAHLIVTDSGGVQEEAPAVGVPVLVTRDTTERPEGVEAGTALLIGPDGGRIVGEVKRLLHDAAAYAAMSRAHNPFGDGKASGRIVEIVRRWFQSHKG